VAGIGLDPHAPGFRHIILHPRVGGGLSWASATLRSIRGPIASAWKLKDGALTLEVSIPANTTATVYIPAAEASTITESGKPAATAEGVHFLRAEQGEAVFEIGSGSYSFAAPRVQK
jgi:alpha-L-rhamnosidase